MGKFINGANGPIQGKIGAVIGSSWKGIPYVKGPYKKRTIMISEREKGNRNKFSLAQSWLSPLLPFVRVGFKGYAPPIEGYVAAKSHILHNAFENGVINPSMVKVSHGDLQLPGNIAVGKINDHQLRYTWDTTLSGNASHKDQVMLLAYNVENAKAYYSLTGQFRSAGMDTLEIDPTKGLIYHIYVAFVADDRSSQSDSMYLGILKNE